MNNTMTMMVLQRRDTKALAGMLAVRNAHVVDSAKKTTINQRAQFAPRRSFHAPTAVAIALMPVCATINANGIFGLVCE